MTSDPTAIQFEIDKSGSTSETYYISQPMLVFGSSIGEGNYTRPQGEVVYFEKKVTSNYLHNNIGLSDEDATLNTEADSNGAVPKGAKGIFVLTNCGDEGSAASAATDTWFTMRADGNQDWIYYNVPQGKADDKRHIKTAWQPCNTDGDVTYGVYASGSDTFDVVQFEYKGVQLR